MSESEYKGNYERIYTVVRQVPVGKVATYGDVARLAGLHGQARLVGYALHALRPHSSVPWHRVVNAKGGISLGHIRMDAALEQRIRLEAEGIEFNAKGRISLDRFRFKGEASSIRAAHGRSA
jgi:methylated-DNA-protein-cysteine methyltransferase-like protein